MDKTFSDGGLCNTVSFPSDFNSLLQQCWETETHSGIHIDGQLIITCHKNPPVFRCQNHACNRRFNIEFKMDIIVFRQLFFRPGSPVTSI